jgi:hypothetical protein
LLYMHWLVDFLIKWHCLCLHLYNALTDNQIAPLFQSPSTHSLHSNSYCKFAISFCHFSAFIHDKNRKINKKFMNRLFIVVVRSVFFPIYSMNRFLWFMVTPNSQNLIGK